MSSTLNTTLNIRIDRKLREDTRKTFKKMGLDMSSGTKVLYRQVVNTQSLPFKIRTENGFTIEQEEKMIKETAWALKYGKRYSDIKELHDDILSK